MAIIIGNKGAIWGVQQPKPLKNFPEGRVKLKIRNTEFVTAFIKTDTGIRKFIVRDTGKSWEPLFEQGRNERSQSP